MVECLQSWVNCTPPETTWLWAQVATVTPLQPTLSHPYSLTLSQSSYTLTPSLGNVFVFLDDMLCYLEPEFLLQLFIVRNVSHLAGQLHTHLHTSHTRRCTLHSHTLLTFTLHIHTTPKIQPGIYCIYCTCIYTSPLFSRHFVPRWALHNKMRRDDLDAWLTNSHWGQGYIHTYIHSSVLTLRASSTDSSKSAMAA